MYHFCFVLLASDPNELTDVLIFTDGNSNCGGNATLAARDLQTVANVYALAIGENWEDAVDELDSYVSRPLPNHVLAVNTTRHLKPVVDLAAKQLDEGKVECLPVEYPNSTNSN